jgi:hypothetical protein
MKMKQIIIILKNLNAPSVASLRLILKLNKNIWNQQLFYWQLLS